MGQVCGKNTELAVQNEPIEELHEEPRGMEGQVYMLLCGIDYSCDHVSWAGPPPAGNGPLDTGFAKTMMQGLTQACGVYPEVMWNEQCTKDGICDKIRQMASQCDEGDTFIFYYTGHGDQLDNDGDDAERKDQCICTVDSNGVTDSPDYTYRAQVWLRDDDFADAFIEGFAGTGAQLLVLLDCCHSASLCDFNTNPKWVQNKIQAISVSGCQDTQTSAGTGKGGMFTRAMTMAIQDLSSEVFMTQERDSYMVSELYNKTLEKYQENKLFSHTQNITIHGTGVSPQQMVWPLQPLQYYTAPANSTMRGMVDFEGDDGTGERGIDDDLVNFGPPEP